MGFRRVYQALWRPIYVLGSNELSWKVATICLSRAGGGGEEKKKNDLFGILRWVKQHHNNRNNSVMEMEISNNIYVDTTIYLCLIINLLPVNNNIINVSQETVSKSRHPVAVGVFVLDRGWSEGKTRRRVWLKVKQGFILKICETIWRHYRKWP